MAGKRLEGKIVIITGGASGIGAEVAKLFTEHGAKVVIVDLQDDLSQNAVVSIGEDKASYYHCDITDETEVMNAVKFTVEKHGKLDVLVTNSGIMEQSGTGSILDLNLERFDQTIAVNVRGAAAFIKHAASAMVASGTRGSIICTTSVAAKIDGAGPRGYTASKHGLLGLVRSACGDLGRHGIRVNGVEPYAAVTKMKSPMLTTRHVAEAALFLASDESAYVSGQNVIVDGSNNDVKSIL